MAATEKKKMSFNTLLLSAALAALLTAVPANAHMAMTIPSKGEPGIPRGKAQIFDRYRNPNDPSVGHACHGLKATGTPALTLKVGELVEGETTFGAGHGGGHCLWAVSTNDQREWFKIQEEIDCTDQSKAGQQHAFTIPEDVLEVCATQSGCVLGWWWTPVLSGACETYSNCWDVKIEGAKGGIERKTTKFTAPIPQCSRVDTNTHFTTHYGPLLDGGGSDPPSGKLPEGVGIDNNDCFTYTVQQGDTLGAIATKFDVPGGFNAIFNANKDILVSPDQIQVGDVLKIPMKDCGNSGGGSSGMGDGGKAILIILGIGIVATGGYFAYAKFSTEDGDESPGAQMVSKLPAGP